MSKRSGVFWLNKMKMIAGIAKSSGAQHCTCERSAAQRNFTLIKNWIIGELDYWKDWIIRGSIL